MNGSVLLVEDNMLNRSMIEDIFEFDSVPARLDWTETAEHGLDLARQRHPDLILMDLRLPGMDGLQAIDILKHDPHTAHIPIWAITAYAMKGDAQRALDAGCDRYITKPIDAGQLRQWIRTFINEPTTPTGASACHES